MIQLRAAAFAFTAALVAASAAPAMDMGGALGPYPMAREASGTSWQPDVAPMRGPMQASGSWMWMEHGFVDVIYDRQGGPRGVHETFTPGMLMVMGDGPAAGGTLGLRLMLSPDPLMGASGYPLLFQTGETADGVTPLTDRQHPHDFFMELATTYSVRTRGGSVFAYFGLPGEPALGPPAFMHRTSGELIPEAPLTHHWLDSTHVSFGVVTLGATDGRWKADGSVFNGREPDPNRWNIETRRLDSYSGRLTWNPVPRWSLQASHGYLASPEQLAPGVAVHRTTASIAETVPVVGGFSSTTLAAGTNRARGHNQPGVMLESTSETQGRAIFARIEWLRTDELVGPPSPLAGREFAVGKLSLGGSQQVSRAGPLAFHLGALGSAYRVPAELKPLYGSHPLSFMLFLRTTLTP
jgi:hypothetical protein